MDKKANKQEEGTQDAESFDEDEEPSDWDWEEE